MRLMKAILKWAFILTFVVPQAVAMAIFIGIPLYLTAIVVTWCEDVYKTWQLGKMQRELDEMERWNREQDKR